MIPNEVNWLWAFKATVLRCNVFSVKFVNFKVSKPNYVFTETVNNEFKSTPIGKSVSVVEMSVVVPGKVFEYFDVCFAFGN